MRSQIKLAGYNPRAISDYSRGQLKKSLGKFGLVETLVWNKASGILVSGHQRLSVTDEKMRYPAHVKDYEITVSVVDLDDKAEKALNVWLNNQSAQGHFDRDGLAAIIGEGISLDDIGFTFADIELEFGGFEGFESAFEKEAKSAEDVTAEIKAIKDRKKESNRTVAADEAEDADYFLMVAFDSRSEKESWLLNNGFQSTAKFVIAAEMLAALESNVATP